MNAERGTPRPPAGLAPVAPGAEGLAWRDAVDRVLGAWLLSGIEGAGLWETIMAGAPRVAGATAVRGIGHPMTSGGLPGASGDQEGAAERRGTPAADARAVVGEPSGAPGE